MSSTPPLPEWKLQLLERRRKEEEEARRREQEQQDRMAKMPAWKREIIERRRAKQGSSTSFSEPSGPGENESGSSSVPAATSSYQEGEPESSVLQEKIGPVHQNPFIQLEKRRHHHESGPPENEVANNKAKQIVDLCGQIPGVRTLRADNVIIIETAHGEPPAQLASDRRAGEAKSGSMESLNELLSRRGGSVTEIRAGEVFIVKSALSRSVEDLNAVGRAEHRASLPEQRQGRVSKLLSRFSQEDSGGVAMPSPPVKSLSTENLTESSSFGGKKPLHSLADPIPARLPCVNRLPSPPCDLPGLTPPGPCTVASYRSQFEAKSSSGEGWPDSPPRRSPTGKRWGREAVSPDRGPRVESNDVEAAVESHSAEEDVQGKALANLRLHSRNSFMVVPLRASASPPPEPKQEASPSPPTAKPPVPTSCSSPSCEQLLPDAVEEPPPEAEAMRRSSGSSSSNSKVKEEVRMGGLGRVSSPHPAMQRRSGNTITINPRKAPVSPVTVVENGIESSPPVAAMPMKKRYPTVEEIQVIGGYLSLQRSCLAKNDRHRKKLKISFSENQLERTFQYPSESSLLEEFGPPEESDSLVSTNPLGDEDEEEEELLLLHRGLPGLLRSKPLIVDESCRR